MFYFVRPQNVVQKAAVRNTVSSCKKEVILDQGRVKLNSIKFH